MILNTVKGRVAVVYGIFCTTSMMNTTVQTYSSVCDAVEQCTRSPMQVALECEDILREVFGHVEGDTASIRKTMAMLATVSKYFSDIALDFLWWAPDTVLPLLRLLERTLILPKPCTGSPCRCPNSVKPISDKEWTRFLAYARRVRALDLRETPIPDNVSHTGLISLFLRAGGQPIFTSLFCLELRLASVSAAMLFFIVTTSASRKLSASKLTRVLGAARNPLDTLIKHVVPMVPKDSHLCQLVLSGSFSTPILETSMRFSGLTKLFLRSPISTRYLQALARIDGLLELFITIDPQTTLPSLPPSTFKSLHCLGLIGVVQHVQWMLEHISAPSLTSAMFNIFRHPLHQEIGGSCRMLTDLLCSRFGSTLVVYGLVVAHMPGAHFQLPVRPIRAVDLLKPLLVLGNLKTIYLHFSMIPLALSSADVRNLAVSWPRLESLQLVYKHDSSLEVPCVFSLAHFAKCCPHLQSLNLSRVECDTPPPASATCAGGAVNTALTVLEFTYVPKGAFAEEYQTIACMGAFVSRVFPNVGGIAGCIQMPQGREHELKLLQAALEDTSAQGSVEPDSEEAMQTLPEDE